MPTAIDLPAALDPVDLASRLLACASVTPARGAVFDVLEGALTASGFAVHRFLAGDEGVENLFATRGSGAPHFAFAGHLDVVPPGPGWSGDPFEPVLAGGLLRGRGAVDMKGAVAAFAAAASGAVHGGTLSLIITGDEEGPAAHGTVALIDWMQGRGIAPDAILVGEPTSEAVLGDTYKIGRRGSVNMWIEIPGVQGHVAYPHLADNPVRRLAAVLARLHALELDGGNAWFQPSNLEVTDVSTDNPASNVTPAAARVRLNIRYNDGQRGPDLVARVRAVVEDAAPGATLRAAISGEAFLSTPGPLADALAASIAAVTGRIAKPSTTGGTSDARFLSKLCPVVEFGLLNATMHKTDEAVAVADLHEITQIYRTLIIRMLPKP
ncbi:MAG TPA: succinyl-diaminopimelate desuccinylase [Sphingomonadaceae bacterium]|nr:succinyl-diaminopimelate desuccinylase [Sphingomonadaceae bacterium]